MDADVDVLALPTGSPAKSLEWVDGHLLDPVGGFRRWRTDDGTLVHETGRPGRSFGSLVDTLAVSPGGRYRVLYARRGTKALLLDDRTLLRELDRSFAFAEDFDYPIALGRLPDGRDVLAHCPESTGSLRIEDVETGEVLAGCNTLSVLGVDGTLHARNQVDVTPGLLASCGSHVLSLHTHPTLLNPATGKTLATWPHLEAGTVTHCYGVQDSHHPVYAYHTPTRRLALAQPDHIALMTLPEA